MMDRPLLVPPRMKTEMDRIVKAFDATKHPRHPKGSSHGGKFAPKGEGASAGGAPKTAPETSSRPAPAGGEDMDRIVRSVLVQVPGITSKSGRDTYRQWEAILTRTGYTPHQKTQIMLKLWKYGGHNDAAIRDEVKPEEIETVLREVGPPEGQPAPVRVFRVPAGKE